VTCLSLDATSTYRCQCNIDAFAPKLVPDTTGSFCQEIAVKRRGGGKCRRPLSDEISIPGARGWVQRSSIQLTPIVKAQSRYAEAGDAARIGWAWSREGRGEIDFFSSSQLRYGMLGLLTCARPWIGSRVEIGPKSQ